jgi:hypothetical protein
MREQTALGKCMICGKAITHSFVVCAVCEQKHGLTMPKRLWPPWAKRLNALHTAQQREERRQMACVVDRGHGVRVYEQVCYGEGHDDDYGDI